MKEDKEIQLFCSTDEYEINQVCAILTENNIQYIRRNDGSGSYMNLYMGQSIQGKRIFVNETDYNKSLELIYPFVSNNINDEKTNETSEQPEEKKNKRINKYVLIRRGFGLLMLGFPIVVIILVIISLINK